MRAASRTRGNRRPPARPPQREELPSRAVQRTSPAAAGVGCKKPHKAPRTCAASWFAAVTFCASTAVAGELDCVLKPSVLVELSSAASGVLEEVSVDRGDTVTAGQVVVRLQSGVELASLELAQARAEADAALKSATAQLDFQQRRLRRNSELARQQVISTKEIDEVETEYQLAQQRLREMQEASHLARVEVQRAEEILALRSIKSPIDGVVVDRFHSPGEHVEVDKILTLAQIDPLYVEAIAPVALFGAIQPGATVQVRPEEPVGGLHQARVTVIDDVVDAASGTFRVRAELPNPDGRVPAGLRCRMLLDGAAGDGARPAVDPGVLHGEETGIEAVVAPPVSSDIEPGG